MNRLGAIAALLLLAGCLEQGAPLYGDPTPRATPTPTATPSAPAQTEDPPTMRTLAAGSMAGTGERAREVFHDDASYQAFWASVREDAEQEAPQADFARETVVAAVADARPNACWGLRITNASATRVEVTTFTPPREMMCASVITHPWHIVALSGAGRIVEFDESTAEGPPPP